MPAVANLEHKVPGRVRVKIPSKRRDRSFFAAVQEKIRPHPNVHHLTASEYTGSVIIHHSGNVEEILALAIELFELSPEDKEVKKLKAVARRSGLPVPEILDATAVVAAGLGVYQFARRGDLGTASENLLAAVGAYRFLDSLRIAAAFAGLGIVQLLRGEWVGSGTSLVFYSLLAHHVADLQRQSGPVSRSTRRRVA